MTALQATRQHAKAVEASRGQAYHNKTKTVVIGLRVSVEYYEALKRAQSLSTGEFGGDAAFSDYCKDILTKNALDQKQGP